MMSGGIGSFLKETLKELSRQVVPWGETSEWPECARGEYIQNGRPNRASHHVFRAKATQFEDLQGPSRQVLSSKCSPHAALVGG